MPDFVRRSQRLSDAWMFAHAAYGRRSSALAHPVAVAALVDDADYPEHVIIAALLHDVVEDTPTELHQLSTRFGDDVCRLVARLTEDDSIGAYKERKKKLRDNAASSEDDRAAAIFAADKLARARTLNDEQGTIEPIKLEHYERTLDALRRHHPDLPFLAELSDQLRRLHSPA